MGLSFFNPWKPIKDTNRAFGTDIQLPRPEKGMKTDAQLAAEEARKNDSAGLTTAPPPVYSSRPASSLPAYSTPTAASAAYTGPVYDWHSAKKRLAAQTAAAQNDALSERIDVSPALASSSSRLSDSASPFDATTSPCAGTSCPGAGSPNGAAMMMQMMRMLVMVLLSAFTGGGPAGGSMGGNGAMGGSFFGVGGGLGGGMDPWGGMGATAYGGLGGSYGAGSGQSGSYPPFGLF